MLCIETILYDICIYYNICILFNDLPSVVMLTRVGCKLRCAFCALPSVLQYERD